MELIEPGEELPGETTSTEVVVDMEPLKTELVGVNEKLTVLIVFVAAFFVWLICKAVYKFFDGLF